MEDQKVLVSGCFDLLHSGHVEFFMQASKYGKLYVRLGTDVNIELLKQHKPMFPETERLFMVRSIRYVFDAQLSEGRGEFDFLHDMDKLKPDIYVVNEDASNLPARTQFCNQRKIRMIILPRIPSPGLPERSSTSIKKQRLEEKQVNFNQIIPWRLCFAGGWLDLDWVNFYCPGCVITINIKYNERICRDRCGLATSSRKHWQALWNGPRPSSLSSEQAAQYLWGAENVDHFALKTKPYVAGSQDHLGLLFPGICKWDYANGSYWPHQRSDLKDPATIKWLESILYLVDIPFVSRPGETYNSQAVNRMTDSKVSHQEKVRMATLLADASAMVWQGLEERNSTKVGRGLSDTMVAWETMLPFTVNPFGENTEESQSLRAFWKQYDFPHTRGCLFTGAGGGYLMVISDHAIPNGVHIEITTAE